uniref:Large ribosomal subunit protein bL28m n=1 Tax=Araucaria cunninghamii TaxID=56994 RepID=A0A0D6QYX8_ARACU
MASRQRAMLKKLLPLMKGQPMSDEAKEALRKKLPNNNCIMGRAKRGIYAGRHIQFGNQISEDGGNKTRRTWKPNVQNKRLFSLILDRFIRVKVTTHAIRCIDKAGGIDEYLLKTPTRKLDNELSLLWKAKIEQKYRELGNMEVGFFQPEEENKLVEAFEKLDIAKKEWKARGKAKTVNQASLPDSVTNI